MSQNVFPVAYDSSNAGSYPTELTAQIGVGFGCLPDAALALLAFV